MCGCAPWFNSRALDQVLSAYMLKWSLVFSPRDPRPQPPFAATSGNTFGPETSGTPAPASTMARELWLAHAAPRRWYNGHEGFGVTRAPTRHGGTVTFHITASALPTEPRAPASATTGPASTQPASNQGPADTYTAPAWETAANVTLMWPAGHGKTGAPLVVQLRLRCSSAAVGAGAVLVAASAAGAKVLRWNATAEMVVVAVPADSAGTRGSSVFTVAAKFAAKHAAPPRPQE